MSERTGKTEDIHGASDYLFSRVRLRQLFENNDGISFGNKAWQGLASAEDSPIISDEAGERLSTKKLSEFLRSLYTTTRSTPKIPGMGVKSWYSLNLIEDYFAGSNQELPAPKEPREDPEFDGQLVFNPGDFTNFACELGVDMGNARRIEEVVAINLFKNNRTLCDLLPKNEMFRLDGAYITTTYDRWMTIFEGVEKITLAQLDQLFYDIETFNPACGGSIPARHHYALVKYLRAVKAAGVDLSQEQSFKPSHPCINPGFRPTPARKEDVVGDIIVTSRPTNYKSDECARAVEEGLFYPMTGLFYEVEEEGDKQYYLSKQRLTKFLGNVVPNYSYQSTLIKENTMRSLIVLDVGYGEEQRLPYADTSYSEGIFLAFNPSDLLSFAEELDEEIIDTGILFNNLRQIAIDSLTSKYIAPQERRSLLPGSHEYDDMRYYVRLNSDIQIVDLSLDFIGKRLEGCIWKSNLSDAYIFCRYFKALRQQGVRIKL